MPAISRAEVLKMAGAVALLGLAPKRADALEVMDAVTNRSLLAVKSWTDWLERNGVRGYFGETGWPSRESGNADWQKWDALGDAVYSVFDAAGVWATAWTANSFTAPTIWQVYSRDGAGGMRANAQAAVVEAHKGWQQRPDGSLVRRGVNTNGGELMLTVRGSFSNENLGTYGKDYRYPSLEDLAYLAPPRYGLVRLPFLWERVQPVPGGPLDGAEVGRIRRVLDDAARTGQVVILDLHNYGFYRFRDGQFPVGSERLSVADFADVWERLSAEFGDHPRVAAYDLMNEPGLMVPMPGGPAGWEAASRAAVAAVRAQGDEKRVMVAGYHTRAGFSNGVFCFTANHPAAWVSYHNVFYTTHGYWGHYGYKWTYDESNAYWQQRATKGNEMPRTEASPEDEPAN